MGVKEGRRPLGRHRGGREYIEKSHEGMGWEDVTGLIWRRTGQMAGCYEYSDVSRCP